MFSGFENPTHLLIVVLVILLLFGAKRLPDMGRSLGTGMREFRNGVLGRESAPPAGGALEPSPEPANTTRQRTPVS